MTWNSWPGFLLSLACLVGAVVLGVLFPNWSPVQQQDFSVVQTARAP